MVEPFIGQLLLVPYNFAPKGWALCNGQLLPINQNQALFALLGTNYGGDGRVTFALPDLRGRVPISSGQGPGLENYALGQAGGVERVSLVAAQIPAHTHALNTRDANADNKGASPPASPAMVGARAGEAHENRQPYVTLNWIIALQGSFPEHS